MKSLLTKPHHSYNNLDLWHTPAVHEVNDSGMELIHMAICIKEGSILIIVPFVCLHIFCRYGLHVLCQRISRLAGICPLSLQKCPRYRFFHRLYISLIDSRARNSNFLLADVSSRILARSWRLVTDPGRHYCQVNPIMYPNTLSIHRTIGHFDVDLTLRSVRGIFNGCIEITL